MDDLICAFVHIANYMLWLIDVYIAKGLDLASLKFKVAAMCGDPKLIVDAIKSYYGASEEIELFGSTKRKPDLPPGDDCGSH